MKNLFLFSCLFFATCFFAQNQSNTPAGSFQILNNTSPQQLQFFKESIEKSNLENYRLKNKRVTLDFKNGFQCELLSAKEVFLKGIPVNMNGYSETFDADFSLPVFTISENGWLLAEYKTTGKSY